MVKETRSRQDMVRDSLRDAFGELAGDMDEIARVALAAADEATGIVEIKQIDISKLGSIFDGPDGFEEINILRKDDLDVVFDGRLIVEVDSRDFPGKHGGGGAHWTELAVYELRNGDWIACSVACSNKDGQFDFGEVQVIPRHMEGNEGGPLIRPDMLLKRDVMLFFKKSWLAKELAEKAGWDVRERIG